MLLKDLIKVLKPGSEVVVTYLDANKNLIDVRRTPAGLNHEKYLLDLKVQLLYVSASDSLLHIIIIH